MIYDICITENGSGKFINAFGIECCVDLTSISPTVRDTFHRDDLPNLYEEQCRDLLATTPSFVHLVNGLKH